MYLKNIELYYVTSQDYIFYFSQWYATVLLIFAPTFRREGARQGCGAYERDRWNNYFFIIFIYLNKHKIFYSTIEQSLKFILIYNLNLNVSFLIFIYELDRFDRCSELTFIFHVIYFIFGARSLFLLHKYFPHALFAIVVYLQYFFYYLNHKKMRIVFLQAMFSKLSVRKINKKIVWPDETLA